MSARDDLAADITAAVERFDPIIANTPSPRIVELLADDLAARWCRRPRVVTTAAELDDIPPGSLGYAGHHPRLLVRRLIWDHGWLLGHEHTIQVTSQELLDRTGDVTVVWVSAEVESGETQGGAS